MKRFYIEPSGITECGVIRITGSDARHIRTVLRLKPGDTIGLFDGTGNEYHAAITALCSHSVEVSIRRRFSSSAESPVYITVAQGFLKERKMDDLVRQLTELGIKAWLPFIAQRSVPRPDPPSIEARIRRWKTIAAESLKQCGRSVPPEIQPVASFEEMLRISQSSRLRVAFWENEDALLDWNRPDLMPQSDTIVILIGPEGGLTDSEITLAKTAGFLTASLGPRILRAETAAVAACALIQYLFGDMRTA